MHANWMAVNKRTIHREAIYTLGTNVHSFRPQKVEHSLRVPSRKMFVIGCYSLWNRRLCLSICLLCFASIALIPHSIRLLESIVVVISNFLCSTSCARWIVPEIENSDFFCFVFLRKNLSHTRAVTKMLSFVYFQLNVYELCRLNSSGNNSSEHVTRISHAHI